MSEDTAITDERILIGIYDSNDQFNTGLVDVGANRMLFRVTMSYFESTLYEELPDDVEDLEFLHFVIEEEPLDGVNRFTNVSEDEAETLQAGVWRSNN